MMPMCAGVCAEVNRIGGHTVDVASLELLATHVFTGCIEAYEDLLASPLAQDAVLQVWFDVCFLGDVLIKGRDATTDAQVQPLQQRWTAVMEQCKSLVDPFDLVIFVPLMETSRAKMLHRCSTLLGTSGTLWRRTS